MTFIHLSSFFFGGGGGHFNEFNAQKMERIILGSTKFMASIQERQAWNFKGTKICSLDEQTKK